MNGCEWPSSKFYDLGGKEGKKEKKLVWFTDIDYDIYSDRDLEILEFRDQKAIVGALQESIQKALTIDAMKELEDLIREFASEKSFFQTQRVFQQCLFMSDY